MDQTDSQFTFVGFDDHITRGNVEFQYELSHKGRTQRFTETLSFLPPTETRLNIIPKNVLTGILQTIHLLLGISYWKSVCPRRIIIKNYALTRDQAEFWNTVYTRGLGEFFYKNSLDYRHLVQFPYVSSDRPIPQPDAHMVTKDRALVLLGAGKDSIVSAELLKKHKKVFSLYSLNDWPVIDGVAKQIEATHIHINRTIDPKLFELNRETGTYNGHIPITAIFSITAVLAAILYNYRYVVASNEASASYGNVNYLGSEINHQWSKSHEFEKLLQEYIGQFIAPDIRYFSLLRPLTELHIAEVFASHNKYFHTFTSCNKNFKLLDPQKKFLWCGECSKCAFVFLLLAAFLSKEDIVGIFNQNLLANEQLLPAYKELLGLEGFKPFECVGTPEESLVAFMTVLKRGEFSDDIIVRSLGSAVQGACAQKKISLDSLFTISKNHSIPEEFVPIVANV